MADSRHYNKAIQMCFANAKELRQQPTAAEDALWEQLRNRRFENLKFRRQHPIANFIADFYCHDLQLVIEVDGGYHQELQQSEEDKKRTQILMEKGIHVFRLTNEEVFHPEFGLHKLKSFIDSLKVPSPAGEG